MELGKFKNLLQPENARLLPLAMYGLARGLARMAIDELMSPKPEKKDANIQYYTDEL